MKTVEEDREWLLAYFREHTPTCIRCPQKPRVVVRSGNDWLFCCGDHVPRGASRPLILR